MWCSFNSFTMFPLYSLFGFIVLHMLMYAGNVYLWRRYRINYAFIFGFKQGTELGYREVMLVSFGLAALALASVLSKNIWVREKLLIPNKSVYFGAMILNIVLRFAWLQTIFNFNLFDLHTQTLITIVSSLEIIRRGMWNFFRLENEHLNNVGKYRAFKSVSLPFNYDEDPTNLEMKIRSAAAEREHAHVDRNIARKLTPAERREKKERKLFDDPNIVETIVSVYRINDLSHPKIRFKVDVNAQENRLTGCVVISEGISVVVVEGGSKSIKRYEKLMLRRTNWEEVVNEDGDKDEDEEKPPNKCVLVAKSSFFRFSVHDCMTEAAARKVFVDAGVAHYWDLAVNFSDNDF